MSLYEAEEEQQKDQQTLHSCISQWGQPVRQIGVEMNKINIKIEKIKRSRLLT